MPEAELNLNFGHGLNLARAERAVLELASAAADSARILVDLSQCRHVDAGASWRVGNALRPFAGRIPITVRVPIDWHPEHPKWFKLFTHSGLGFPIARYAQEVLAGSHSITDQVRAYYAVPRSDRKLVLDAWASSTYLLIPNILAGELTPGNETHFGSRVLKLFPGNIFDVAAYSHQSVQGLLRLLFESAQNVWDHADKQPLPRGTDVFSFLAMRYFRDITPPKALTIEFTEYLRRAKEASLDDDTEGFIELVISDDGVGVAARHSQDPSIYSHSFDRELEILFAAFQPGSSVKPRVGDATLRGQPGFGFTHIMDSLRQLRAFAVLRTGRALLYLDSISGRDFEHLASPLGYLPGSVLQVVFPRRLARLWSIPDAD